jgi:hypothetical protein
MPATTTYSKLKQYVRRTAARDGVSTFDDDKTKAAIPDGFTMLDTFRDWSFLRREVKLVTEQPYEGDPNDEDADGNAERVAYNDKSTDITGTQTLFETATPELGGGGVKEGDYIEVDGEQIWYEIAADAASETSLTLRSPYRGVSAVDKDFIIVRPGYDVPTDFKSLRKLVAQSDIADVRYVDPENFLDLQANFAGASQPYYFTISERTDDGLQRIVFFPPPNEVYTYELRYNRLLGFLDISSNNDWLDPRSATVGNADIVLWDDRLMSVMRLCIIAAAYAEYEPDKANMAEDRAMVALERAGAQDSKNKEPFLLGGGFPTRPHWY